MLVVSTNQNVCVRYVFLEKLGMRNLLLEQVANQSVRCCFCCCCCYCCNNNDNNKNNNNTNSSSSSSPPPPPQWLFSASMLAVTPGQTYKISVSNIPKPEQGHSSYDVSIKLQVPGEHQKPSRTTKNQPRTTLSHQEPPRTI